MVPSRADVFGIVARVHGLCLLSAGMIACSRAENTKTDLKMSVDTIGDATVSHTLEGSVWRGAARLEPELTIGLLGDSDKYAFGDVVEIVAAASGDFFVFDRQVPALRHFDHQGRLVKTLGSVGDGPGEYRAIVGMAVRADGTLLAHDPQSRRINLYDREGNPSGRWLVNSGLFASQSLLIDSIGDSYVKILTDPRQPDGSMPWPWPVGLLRLDSVGRLIDTLRPPTIAGEPTVSKGPLGPQKVWTITPYETVVGVNDKYEFEIRHTNGRKTLVVRESEQVSLLGAEWSAFEAARHAREAARKAPTHAVTPKRKPFFREFSIGTDGRVWVRKYMQSAPQTVDVNETDDPLNAFLEPVAYDVFERDGKYLGELKLPSNAKLLWIGSTTVFCVRTGAQGEQQVVRYRVVEPHE